MKNKYLTSYIQGKHTMRVMGYVALTLLIMIVVSIFLPNYYPVTKTEAVTKAANPSELTFTSTSSSATVSLDVTDANGSFATSSSNVAFAIRTNNATGYTLNLKSSSNSTALVNDTNTSSISSITSATTYSTFSGTSSASRALNNKWGIIPSKYNGANNTSNYYPASSTGFKMDETAVANTTANNYTIGLGIRANFDAATGTYANATLLIEYVANPVTYSINYNKNTAATVTGMPSPNPQGGTISQGTTATSVNLATAPSRTGYTFLGWCKGTSNSSNITTSNGIDTCNNASTNQFEAGQSFGINATGTSPDTYYLYAMWSANSYTCTKRYRLQNADGSWGAYQNDGTEQIKYDATCSYSKTITNYKGSTSATNNSTASVSGVMNSTDGITVSLDLYRNTFSFKVGYRYQNADGSYGSVTNVVNTTKRYGESYSWSTADIPNFNSTIYQAASYANNNITANVDQTVSINRNTVTITRQYRTQGTDGNYSSNYTTDGTATVLYGANYTYSRTATTEYQAASTTLTNVTSAQTISLDVPRKTITVTKQYRTQDTNGNYPTTYTTDGTASVLYGATYTYSRAATTSHQAASTTSGVITGNTTISLDVPRKTITVTKQYRTQDTNGNYPTTYTTDGTASVLYGATYTYSRAATTEYQAASTSLSNVTSAQTISLSVPRNVVVCNKQYKLENANGSWGNYTADGSVNAYYGGSCSYSKTVTNYRGASNAANGAQGSVTASNVTATQTLSLDFYRNTFTCKISYKYQAANGTYGSATVAVNTTKRYGEACSWSTASITNFNSAMYKAANYTNNSITANVDTTVSIDRNTFTVTKQYKLQDENGNYPSSYTADGTETIRYGDSYTYSRAATTTHQAASKDSGAVTGVTTVSLDVPRKLVACNKQYKLENADGSWTAYTSDGSVNAYYGGSCTYSKTVTDYKGASNATNGAQGSVTASNVTSTQTLSLDFYRNTYTLTVTAGTNTSNGTGGGSKRWGQTVTVGVTKAANATCVTYATPTWTATTGTAPAAGASSTYTMPKSNATVTATSAASNVAQTITLSRSGGASGINIGGTNYTGSSVSLNCGTYNISGNYTDGYEFSSWSRANGVAVTNTAAASTTMVVTAAGTLTLTGKTSAPSFIVNFDSGIDSVIVRGNTVDTSTILTTVTTSGTNIGSMVSIGGTYYLLPLYKQGKTLNNITASGGTVTAGTYGYRYYTIAIGANSVTVSSSNLATTSSTTMQNLAAATCLYYPTAVKDSRDDEIYYIQRLADGNCWMLDNMRLGGSSSITLTQNDSNVGGFTGTVVNGQPVIVPLTSYTLPASSWSLTETQPKIYAGEKNNTDSTHYGPGSGKTGVLYNPCVVTSGNFCSSSSSSSSDFDICPAGWRLPTAIPNGEFQTLMDDYGAVESSNDKTLIYGRVTNYNKAISATLSGSYANSRVQEAWAWMASSSYHSSCKSTDGTRPGICFSGTGPGSATPTDNNMWQGMSVRCILKTGN